MLTIVLFACAIALSMLAWFVYYKWMTWGFRHLPTLKYCAPFIGHAISLRRTQHPLIFLHETMLRMKTRFLRVVAGNYIIFIISDPSYLEDVMASIMNKMHSYRFAHSWVGTGLTTASGSKWRARRKLLEPAYHFKLLSQFTDVFDKNAKILVEQLRPEIQKESTNIYPYMSRCALDMICETAMGTTINAQTSNSLYLKKIQEQVSLLFKRWLNPLKHLDFLYKFTDSYRREVNCLKVIHDFSYSIIRARRNELLVSSKMNRKGHDDNDVGVKKCESFLDLLLHSTVNGQLLSDEDIREEVDTFMFAGYDTISAGMSFITHCISKHPEVQTRLIDEQRTVFGDNPQRMTTLKDLNKMCYLEMVIKETMRMHPPVPFIGRLTTEDVQIKDCRVRKGTEIIINIMTMHHDERLYPEPERFDPERFAPETQTKRHRFTYMPFSAGPRNCIGQKFAMLEMKSVMSMLLRNYDIKEASNSGLDLTADIVLGSRNGINVTLKPRVW